MSLPFDSPPKFKGWLVPQFHTATVICPIHRDVGTVSVGGIDLSISKITVSWLCPSLLSKEIQPVDKNLASIENRRSNVFLILVSQGLKVVSELGQKLRLGA